MKEISEDYIQNQIVIQYTNRYCLAHHKPRCLIMSIPNGGNRNAREALKFKLTGLLPGASDLIVIHKGELVFVEVKTSTGTQQAAQKHFADRVTALGFKYILVRSVDEFMAYFC